MFNEELQHFIAEKIQELQSQIKMLQDLDLDFSMEIDMAVDNVICHVQEEALTIVDEIKEKLEEVGIENDEFNSHDIAEQIAEEIRTRL